MKLAKDSKILIEIIFNGFLLSYQEQDRGTKTTRIEYKKTPEKAGKLLTEMLSTLDNYRKEKDISDTWIAAPSDDTNPF